jgi:hypothetical protein
MIKEGLSTNMPVVVVVVLGRGEERTRGVVKGGQVAQIGCGRHDVVQELVNFDQPGANGEYVVEKCMRVRQGRKAYQLWLMERVLSFGMGGNLVSCVR